MAAAFADPDAQPLTQAQIDGWRPPTLSKVVRNKLRMTRAAFADAYGIPEATQEAWERHKAEPSAVEIAYLRLIERKPDVARLGVT